MRLFIDSKSTLKDSSVAGILGATISNTKFVCQVYGSRKVIRKLALLLYRLTGKYYDESTIREMEFV